jgi:hypothetical protein
MIPAVGLHAPLLPLLAALAVPAEAAQAASPPGLVTIVDDRGLVVEQALDVCVRRREERACVSRPGAPAPLTLEATDTVEVEGPEHGPMSYSGTSLAPGEGGLRLAVPRKARLRLPGADRLAISLLPLDAPEPARPRHRVSALAGEAFAPAGDWLASILGASEGEAPELRVLLLKPGAVVSLPRSPRKGWSLAVRTTDGDLPLEEADVALHASGAADPAANPIRSKTGAFGLALFSGLPPGDVDVEVTRRGFVPTRRPWVSSAPGTFTLRSVPMERAGAILLRLESTTLPVAGVLCNLLDDEARPPTRDATERKAIRSGRTDETGAIRLEDVPRGRWAVRILPGGRFGVDEPFDVETARTSEKTVAIDEIPVTGSVTRGGEPVPDAVVQIRSRASRGLPSDDAGFVRATTGEDGRYEAVVLTEGSHDFVLFVGEAPVESKPAFVSRGGAEVDFDLNEHAVRGRVVDDEGRPVEAATVALRLGDSAKDGRFEFPLLGRGTARLLASRTGFRDSDPSLLEVGDGPPPETVLTLTRLPAVRGRLLLATGSPAPGQPVASVDGSGRVLEETRTDAEGRFELRAEPGTTWLLTGGPACALATTLATSGPEEVVLRCAALPATLSLVLRDAAGSLLPREALLLRLNGGPVPVASLQRHLASLGLPPTTDAAGRIDLVSLAPGLVEAFAARAASLLSIAGGHLGGLLTTRMLAPGERAEEAVTLRAVSRTGP